MDSGEIFSVDLLIEKKYCLFNLAHISNKITFTFFKSDSGSISGMLLCKVAQYAPESHSFFKGVAQDEPELVAQYAPEYTISKWAAD